MATPEDVAVAPVAAVATSTPYCSQCGQENPAHRGACVMCFTPLHQTDSGMPCPNGHDNPKEALFCQVCGTALGAKPKPKTISEAALAVLHGGVAALTAEHEGEEGFYEEEEESGFLGGHAEAPAAPAPAPVAPPAPAPAPVHEEEEDMGLGPNALALEESAAVPLAPPAPPPPPAAEAEHVVHADEFEDLFAEPAAAAPPPPPAPEAAVEEDFAPPPPPPAIEDEDFAPPPPPPGLEEEAPAAPAPPPAAPPAAPAAPPAEGEDEDFGDWSLDMEDKSSS